MNSLDDWYRALDQLGKRPKWHKNGREIRAACPAHPATSDDGLSVEDKDGRTVWYCHSGCDGNKVREAVGFAKPSGPPPPTRPRPKGEEPPPPKPGPLPKGPPWWPPFVYHDAQGTEVLAVVRKDEGRNRDTGKMRKTFRQFTPAGDDLWARGGLKRNRPLFRLPRLSEQGRVLVVEGEKCVMACEKAWPDQLTTCWAGGANTWQRTDWTPLRGRDVDLLADADDASHKAMRQLAYYLDTELECAVRIALPEGEPGEDVADWLKEGMEAAAERIASLLKPYTLDDSDSVDPPREPRPPVDGDILDNPFYQVLGLDGDDVALWWKRAGRMVSKSPESLTQPSTLIGIASQEFWCSLAGTDQFGTATARRVGDGLIRQAEGLGQVDTSRRTGRGAIALDNGNVVFHLGDRLLADGAEILLHESNGGSFYGRLWQSDAPIELGPEASETDMRKVAEAVMAYRWATPADGQRLLGWIVASLVGGALEWRPHMILYAPAAAGKTWDSESGGAAHHGAAHADGRGRHAGRAGPTHKRIEPAYRDRRGRGDEPLGNGVVQVAQDLVGRRRGAAAGRHHDRRGRDAASSVRRAAIDYVASSDGTCGRDQNVDCSVRRRGGGLARRAAWDQLGYGAGREGAVPHHQAGP